MQEDFKNQLQNALGLWRKKGQTVVDQILKEAIRDFQERISKHGVAVRWTSIVNLMEELIPEASPKIASILGKQTSPIANWLGIAVKNWKPYKIELTVSPSEHLICKSEWQSIALFAMAETAGRWLIEKHCPPGPLIINVLKVELESFSNSSSDCTVRCELEPLEFEKAMAQLLKNNYSEIFLPVMILTKAEVLMSQANFNFELKWTPHLSYSSDSNLIK